mgnify:CR=1 FL=1
MAKSSFFEGVDKVSNDDFYQPAWCSWFFAECSRLAYKSKLKARKEYRRIGFTTYNFYSVEGAQVHVAKNSDVIVIAFRGTEPKQFSDIKADLMAWKKRSRVGGQVHAGFKGEVDKLWADIRVSLGRKGGRDIYLCGHSLGGAMATICASRLISETNSGGVEGLYTYGSPKVGGRKYTWHLHVQDLEHHRFVNNNDMVTRTPLWIMGYRHYGYLTYINHYGNIRPMTSWQRFKDKLRGRWAALRKFQFFDGIRDHNINKYCEKLKQLVKIEPTFGGKV